MTNKPDAGTDDMPRYYCVLSTTHGSHEAELVKSESGDVVMYSDYQAAISELEAKHKEAMLGLLDEAYLDHCDTQAGCGVDAFIRLLKQRIGEL